MIYRAFPKIDMTEKSAIRYTSSINEWIDFVTIVDNQYKNAAQQAINAAMDEFWNSDECYGDCVEYYLNEASIPRMTFYYDPYGDIDEYDRTWEAFIKHVCENKEHTENESFNKDYISNILTDLILSGASKDTIYEAIGYSINIMDAEKQCDNLKTLSLYNEFKSKFDREKKND